MRLLTGICAVCIATACHPFRGTWSNSDARDHVDYQLNRIRAAIEAYRDSTGRLPPTLNTICPALKGSEVCPFWPLGDSLLDAWKRSILYELVNDEYRVGSAGADGVVDTQDDFVIQPSRERATVMAIAGCYQLDLTWLSGIEADTILRLGNTRPHEYVYWYHAAPMMFYTEPGWRPMPADSIVVSWVHIHHSAEFRLLVGRDSLIGIAHASGGAASWQGPPFSPRQVTGARVSCS